VAFPAVPLVVAGVAEGDVVDEVVGVEGEEVGVGAGEVLVEG